MLTSSTASKPLLPQAAAPRTLAVLSGVLEPVLISGLYLVFASLESRHIGLADILLAFLLFALAFPGRDHFSLDLPSALIDILLGWIQLLAIVAVCGWITSSFSLFSRQVAIAWALVTPLSLMGLAVAHRIWSHRAAARQERPRAVVVGGGALAARTIQALQAGSDDALEGVDVLGIFDDRDATRATEATSLPLLGGLRDLGDYIRVHRVSKVFVTMPLNTQPRIQSLIDSISDTTAELYYVPDVFGVSIIQGRLQLMDGVPVVGLLESPFTGVNALIKRGSDIVLSLIAIVLALPLLIGSAIAVRVSSPGPIIFRQRRHGMDGKEIMVYKFRSMTTMDNGAVVKQASRDDARVTKVGKILRKTSLDELPQLINVLQGRMSMVGPRPHAIAHNDEYRKLITAYMMRHKVKPGITGWAQIHGHRGPTETVDKMRTRIDYDLEYLRKWSLRLDLEILVRTVTTVLFDKHAF